MWRATFRPPRFDFFEGTGCGRAPWPQGESRRSREGWRCHRSSARYLGRRRKGWDERDVGQRCRSGPGSRVLGAIGAVCPAGAGLERRADRGRSAPPKRRIILSMERGPSVVRMISATACGGVQRRGGGVQSRVFARRPSVARGMWRLAPNARGGFDRRSGSWGWGIRDATHLSGGDVVQLRGATGLTLRVGVWMGRRGAIGQSMDSRGGRGKP